MIHNGLRPSNVLIGSFGEVQIVDWGLAKVLVSGERERSEPDPESPEPDGAPACVAPEQAGVNPWMPAPTCSGWGRCWPLS